MAETPILNLETEELRTTPLDALHRRLGARMVAFAGYSLPVHYPAGVLAEHLHTRKLASLFDISHMGQISLHGEGAGAALEALVPGDITGLSAGRQRYTLLLNEVGGIVDDLMVARHGGRLFVIANASRTETDAKHMAEHLPEHVRLELHDDRALLALQGPASGAVMARLSQEAAGLAFMAVAELALLGTPAFVSRSGYTGEDGFEISVPSDRAEALAEWLLQQPEVAPAGLGARDSLRLEAGLALYGADIDELTTPVEANLAWAIAGRRREAGDFLGAAVLHDQLEHGPARLRVGLRALGRAPARADTLIVASDGTQAGGVTSGGFSPTLGAPVAMGYVRRDLAGLDTPLHLMIRGKPLPARVVALPFVPHNYVR